MKNILLTFLCVGLSHFLLAQKIKLTTTFLNTYHPSFILIHDSLGHIIHQEKIRYENRHTAWEKIKFDVPNNMETVSLTAILYNIPGPNKKNHTGPIIITFLGIPADATLDQKDKNSYFINARVRIGYVPLLNWDAFKDMRLIGGVYTEKKSLTYKKHTSRSSISMPYMPKDAPLFFLLDDSESSEPLCYLEQEFHKENQLTNRGYHFVSSEYLEPYSSFYIHNYSDTSMQRLDIRAYSQLYDKPLLLTTNNEQSGQLLFPTHLEVDLFDFVLNEEDLVRDRTVLQYYSSKEVPQSLPIPFHPYSLSITEDEVFNISADKAFKYFHVYKQNKKTGSNIQWSVMGSLKQPVTFKLPKLPKEYLEIHPEDTIKGRNFNYFFSLTTAKDDPVLSPKYIEYSPDYFNVNWRLDNQSTVIQHWIRRKEYRLPVKITVEN